jgi:NAD(P)-dependent dehydrogenase (short-subunit alcohol dehydrogenase family)
MSVFEAPEDLDERRGKPVAHRREISEVFARLSLERNLMHSIGLLDRVSVQVLTSAIAACGVLLVAAAAHAAPQDSQPLVRLRTVLVTGANRGLGFEFAKQYHAAGWNVVGTAREPEEAKELKALGVRVEALDVASGESVAALAQRLSGVPIDLLINNAGVSSVKAKSLEDVKLDEYARVIEVNAIGPVRVTQALLPNLRAGKGKRVVSISSGLGSTTDNSSGGYWAYRESKTALNMFMRSLAAELRSAGFICIAMSPGWVKTDMGGPGAPLEPEASIAGMRKVIDGLKPEDTGKFFSYDGSTVAW